ncbi:MAG: hypothetical protein JRI23_21915, partial [Deltaproteobacteria bacterium]|nr:hypothetical protein [Deltaproteobacteria bacterium]MBW2534615.1 hypothetical protein [Deltaproteobacteria bacterium]
MVSRRVAEGEGGYGRWGDRMMRKRKVARPRAARAVPPYGAAIVVATALLALLVALGCGGAAGADPLQGTGAQSSSTGGGGHGTGGLGGAGGTG